MPRNLCLFRGNLTRDPEVRTVGGKTVASFSLAVNGYKKDDVEFIDCEVWEKTAEFVRDNIVKGDQVEVSTRFKTEKWNDKETGNPRSKPRFRVNDLDAIKLKKWNGEAVADVEDDTPPPKASKSKPAHDDDDNDDPIGF